MPTIARRPWAGRVLALVLFPSIVFALVLFALLSSGNSAPRHIARSAPDSYTWNEWQYIPLGLDAETWASQHQNFSRHRSAVRDDKPINDQVHTCGVDRPCTNGACCGRSKYCGFGPTYCGDGCLSNCNAKADCGQYSEGGNVTCPLNVCCSQYGFCGTTSEFCGTGCQSNCRTPTDPGSHGDVRSTVIGYYEGWKGRLRPGDKCAPMTPSQIPIEGLTGLDFAFAYITPDTYDIIPMGGIDTDMFAQVTNQKISNPDAKIYISVGGWAFSNNGTRYQQVFGDIASSTLKRFKFASKLYQFMVQYGFDGVDLDWEYPGAPDRGGTEADVDNYPLLLQAIKTKFKVEKAAFGITITVPSSYWYLRWFDLPQITRYTDRLNLMSYDLHGVWDSHDPYGPHVYAHTNLTEIDQALNLLWRVHVDPSLVNLGLAFYGRSFKLKDPSCTEPGCEFSGGGKEGKCTQTSGLLSYREIQDILRNKAYMPTYDPVAAINYLVYDEDNWVSFDDKTTFQQKIDFANRRGLHGLFIWAIDLDDLSRTALKAVTGTDLTRPVHPSQTLGHWGVNYCFISDCGVDCPMGFTTMTGLNLDENGKGCPNAKKHHAQRKFCCPAWGAPDPSTCSWHGTAPGCFGQCKPGEVMMVDDNFGEGKRCDNGLFKAFCCPATSGQAAVAQCKTSDSSSCPSDRPQKINTIGTINGPRPYCCPAEPTFSNCKWHGHGVTCAGNRCPVGQIEMARSKNSDGGLFSGCTLGRQAALCCDPPFSGTAFVPVPLEDLFPQDLPASAEPVYYEAFGYSTNEYPQSDLMYSDDPNKEPFAWTIMVGAEADVQSLRKRDGSDLETFDCPNPSPSDYGVQTVRAVCASGDADNNNCEDITIGSVHGTIIRLPEHCGPDEWVRAVSFRQLQDHPLPAHLSKRVDQSAKVYEIKYDYNLRHLRRDGGEVYVRFDASVHPGYWDEIVSSSPGGSISRRSSKDWRSFHMEWFDHKINKRGFSDKLSWWRERFENLLTGHYDYGLHKEYPFKQNLYNAAKRCEPYGQARMSADVEGHLATRLDFGLSLIGTLRDFDFSESYAYFNLHNLEVNSSLVLSGEAGIQYQSQVLQLLDEWDPWGGSFNLKGLWTIGPYFDATAQFRGLAAFSGRMSSGLSMSTSSSAFTYMFPETLGRQPSEENIVPLMTPPSIETGYGATMSADGSITITVTPRVGFRIELDAFGEQLVDTRITASFSNSAIARVGMTSDDCQGARYGLDYRLNVDIGLQNPLPGFGESNHTFSVFDQTTQMSQMLCRPWNETLSKRSELLGRGLDLSERSLAPRDEPVGSLFPDPWATLLSCPMNTNTTGNCRVSILPDNPSDDSMQSNLAARDEDEDEDESINLEKRTLHELHKREKKIGGFCTGGSKIILESRTFPSSSELVQDRPNVDTYGPLNPEQCDDYSFGTVSTPSGSDTSNFATEHVLEWQVLLNFWRKEVFEAKQEGKKFSDPKANPGDKKLDICQYLKFWWSKRHFTINGETGYPVNLVVAALPGKSSHADELMLLDKDTNGIKERLWGHGDIRKDTKMMQYINGVDKEGRERDVYWAINTCKGIIYAFKYVNDNEVSNVLVDQATRVGEHFDEVEDFLANFYSQGFNSKTYEKQNFGSKWRSFIYKEWQTQAQKGINFLNDWVPKLVEAHHSANQGELTMGGIEVNEQLLNNIRALAEAWQEVRSNYPNPFPSGWNS